MPWKIVTPWPPAARREAFGRITVAAVDVLPVVHHPHIAGRADRQLVAKYSAHLGPMRRVRNCGAEIMPWGHPVPLARRQWMLNTPGGAVKNLSKHHF